MSPICEIDKEARELGEQEISRLLRKLCRVSIAGSDLSRVFKPPEVSEPPELVVNDVRVKPEVVVTKVLVKEDSWSQLADCLPRTGVQPTNDQYELLHLFGIDGLFAFRREILPSQFVPKTVMVLSGFRPFEFVNYKRDVQPDFLALSRAVEALAILPAEVLRRYLGSQDERPFYLLMVYTQARGLACPNELKGVARISPTRDGSLVENIALDLRVDQLRFLAKPDLPVVVFGLEKKLPS